MKLCIAKHNTYHMAYEECTLHFLYNFFSVSENRESIIMVFKQDIYYGKISYDDAVQFQSDLDIYQYLERNNGKCLINLGNLKQIDYLNSLFEKCYMSFIPLMEDGKVTDFFLQVASVDTNIIFAKREEIRNYLIDRGISTYFIRLPKPDNMKRNIEYATFHKIFWSEECQKKVKCNIHNITEGDYESTKKSSIQYYSDNTCSEDLDDRKTIYLVGPCTVAYMPGTFLYEEIASLLYEKCFPYYSVKKNIEFLMRNICFDSIMEHNIYEGDIVVFIDSFPQNIFCDFDVTDLFRNCAKWAYTDVPYHTTFFGNQLIVNCIMSKLFDSSLLKCKERGRLIHKSKKSLLTYDAEEELKDYLCEIKAYQEKHCIEITSTMRIGAIVMNANPFTLGHQYLVQYASEKVDYLYVFVVEEDSSTFSYNDRKTMVEQGVKNFQNILVIRSGDFIISRRTFSTYFEKDKYHDREISATLDLEIFTRFIAPELHISIRFVGEEPFDAITAQYNFQMKDILPKYGIEVCEVPRKGIENNIISATKVRYYFEHEDWKKLEMLVPKTTYSYLKNRINTGKECSIEINTYLEHQWEKIEIETRGIEKLLILLARNEKVIMYGIGHDAQIVCNRLGKKNIEKLLFCDKKAKLYKVHYYDKQVMSPELIPSGSFVFIASRKNRDEIYNELLTQGIAKEKIIFIPNTI